jgi:hypothetical protein
MRRRAVLFPFLLLLSGLFTGCFLGAPSLQQVRWELQRRFPEARFERQESFHLGRISMGLIRGIVRMVPGEVEGRDIVSSLRRIEVATYRVSSLPDLDRIQGETRFADQLARDGWSMAVRTQEAGSRAWIFLRSDEAGALRNLFVVALEEDELTMVRIDGRLDQALAEAIALAPKDAVRRIKAPVL